MSEQQEIKVKCGHVHVPAGVITFVADSLDHGFTADISSKRVAEMLRGLLAAVEQSRAELARHRPLLEAARAAREELQAIAEWARVERAPLRKQELDSIARCGNRLRDALDAAGRGEESR